MSTKKYKPIKLADRYSNEELLILKDCFSEVDCFIGYNPFSRYYSFDESKNNLQVWYEGASEGGNRGNELASLIDGRLEYEDLPLHIGAINEYYKVFLLWRLKIGK